MATTKATLLEVRYSGRAMSLTMLAIGAVLLATILLYLVVGNATPH